ncbi:hypothetical protein GCWU000324_02548 [Kingella oralis ATCC 51147]|uniref:Uncharacterized protein n=1 Tax=Kingella oralis ATCC 51147 TaxID=629741 RepID=C4GLH7_9NEIS|nr:hypothetical protein GCWU000324_02548 [Kingella oralis ATCC 51147]
MSFGWVGVSDDVCSFRLPCQSPKGSLKRVSNGINACLSV